MKQNVLLLEDIESLGRSGDIVAVASGYARNFLIPKKKGVIAKKHTVVLQKKLQEKRKEIALKDKQEAEELAKTMSAIVLEKNVKVDPEGKMYGSVTVKDILELLEKENIKLDKKNVILDKPIKSIGEFIISFKLKEGIETSCKLLVKEDDKK